MQFVAVINLVVRAFVIIGIMTLAFADPSPVMRDAGAAPVEMTGAAPIEMSGAMPCCAGEGNAMPDCFDCPLAMQCAATCQIAAPVSTTPAMLHELRAGALPAATPLLLAGLAAPPPLRPPLS